MRWLYCAGFAGYVRALLPWETPDWAGKVIGIVLIIAVVLINMVGSTLVGRSELFVVTIELAILGVFAVFGSMKADPARLSEAGAAAAGRVGFVVIGVAALLATASGVNATMFGDANLAFVVAKSVELPRDFTRGVWRNGNVGLLVAAVLTALFVVYFPLSAVARWPAWPS